MSDKCVQIIPNQSNVICPYKSDLGALEANVKNDIENKKKPLIVFARAGIFYFINITIFCCLLIKDLLLCVAV